MVKDPVCGMQVDPQRAAAHSTYNGQTYYFCSTVCKGTFDREPEKYHLQAGGQQKDSQHQHAHHSSSL